MTKDTGLMRSPTIPTWKDLPPVEAFETLGLELDLAPIRRVHQLRHDAVTAVQRLKDSRPGGPDWKAAETADVEAILADKKPGKVAKLLATDSDRWSQANLLSLAFARAASDPLTELRAAANVAIQLKLTELEEEFKDTALAGWHVRADKPAAWAHRLAAQSVLDVWQVAVGLQRWSSEAAPYKAVKDLHPGDQGGGAWVSLCWMLDGRKSWLVATNSGLVWPPGADEELWGYRVSELGRTTPSPRVPAARW